MKLLTLILLVVCTMPVIGADLVPIPDSVLHGNSGYYADTSGIGAMTYGLAVQYHNKLYSTHQVRVMMHTKMLDSIDNYAVNDTIYPVLVKSEYATFSTLLSQLSASYGPIALIYYGSFQDTSRLNTILYVNLAFENPYNYDTVNTMLHQISTLSLSMPDPLLLLTADPADRILDATSKFSELDPGVADDNFWKRILHTRGFGWHLYSVNAPMAWNITQGRGDVTTVVHDQFNTAHSGYDNNDIFVKTTTSSSGNWLSINPSTQGDSHVSIPGTVGITKSHCIASDGSILKYNHGVKVAATMLGARNGGSYIGVAPKCCGYGIWVWLADECTFSSSSHVIDDLSKVSDIDVDYQNNNVLTPAAVINCSHTGGLNSFTGPINNGIVCVSGASNDIKSFGSINTQGPIDIYSCVANTPSAIVITPDPNDPTKDVKGITVGALMDGDILDANCQEWKKFNPQVSPVNMKGKEKPDPLYMYSPGVNKFDVSANTQFMQ